MMPTLLLVWYVHAVMNAVDLYFKRGKSVLCVGKTSRAIPRRIADVLLSSGSATLQT